jgi:hypothetical protein
MMKNDPGGDHPAASITITRRRAAGSRHADEETLAGFIRRHQNGD